MTAPPRKRPRFGQRQRLALPLGQPEPLHPLERRRVERRLDARERHGLVQPEPEQQPLAPLHLVVEGLVLARRRLAAPERRRRTGRDWARSASGAPPTVETAPIPMPT